MTVHKLELLLLKGSFAVCRLDAGAPIPSWAIGGSFFALTRTAEELSVVCAEDDVLDGVRCERGWRGLRVAGTIPFSAVGVLASLVIPLAEAGISVFVLSTYDTDYLLVREGDLERSVAALCQNGYRIVEPE